MRRLAFEELLLWKQSENRKPLILKGARQVGKTWLMQEFGKREYEKVAYVNLEAGKSLRSIFENDFDVERILTALQIETGVKITPKDTLIIFDEIQEATGAITSLKYFYENAPGYHIMAAGSLLGVALHQQTSFPVGKVEFMDLYPMSFREFLLALKQDSLFEILKTNDWPLIATFRGKLMEYLKQYYFVGGMPEAVKSFSEERDFVRVRKIQSDILEGYEQDFSKHVPPEVVPRLRMLWKSIPSQLSKERRKFIYGAIRQGARAKDFEIALAWLADCGLVHKVHRISKPAIPLVSYMDASAFKLYVADTGLLAAMGNLDVRTLLESNSVFIEFKGALTEQYVLQQLITKKNTELYYWSSETARAEVDFVLQKDTKIIPIEVKAEENLMAKSLKSYYQKFTPSEAIRTSMSDYRKSGWLINVPLYAIEFYRF